MAEELTQARNFTATVEGGELVIRVPLQKPTPSKSSGKTLIVATTSGNKPSTAIVEGQPVIVSVNAYIYPPK